MAPIRYNILRGEAIVGRREPRTASENPPQPSGSQTFPNQDSTFSPLKFNGN